ncbi:MAG: hypothetical protein WCT49_02690 [Candidatus Paceibacterota bacterium]|jgi:hypothetical protein|nr:hypothetical protein [Candidatus Paceibacterota bacterium]
MNKKAIIKAYDSYILMQQASAEFEKKIPQEDDILEILRVLQESYKNDGFYVDEIVYVGRVLHWDLLASYNTCYSTVCKILWKSLEKGTVVVTKQRRWKIVPPTEVSE